MNRFKYLGNKESMKELWENREALDKYLKRLKELMEEDATAKEEASSQTLTQMEQGWISVKDSIKPNVDEWVLCAINNSILCYLFIYQEGRGFYGYDDAQIDNRITHWRPLPLPPMPNSKQDKL